MCVLRCACSDDLLQLLAGLPNLRELEFFGGLTQRLQFFCRFPSGGARNTLAAALKQHQINLEVRPILLTEWTKSMPAIPQLSAQILKLGAFHVGDAFGTDLIETIGPTVHTLELRGSKPWDGNRLSHVWSSAVRQPRAEFMHLLARECPVLRHLSISGGDDGRSPLCSFPSSDLVRWGTQIMGWLRKLAWRLVLGTSFACAG